MRLILLLIQLFVKNFFLNLLIQVDAASVHLKAANLPRQANKVILPINLY